LRASPTSRPASWPAAWRRWPQQRRHSSSGWPNASGSTGVAERCCCCCCCCLASWPAAWRRWPQQKRHSSSSVWLNAAGAAAAEALAWCAMARSTSLWSQLLEWRCATPAISCWPDPGWCCCCLMASSSAVRVANYTNMLWGSCNCDCGWLVEGTTLGAACTLSGAVPAGAVCM
jgi:hypothetical protein